MNPFSFHPVEFGYASAWIPACAGMTGWAGSSPARPLNFTHLLAEGVRYPQIHNVKTERADAISSGKGITIAASAMAPT